MSEKLTVINGGRMNVMKDVYEIHTADGDIVDVMGFSSREEASYKAAQKEVNV